MLGTAGHIDHGKTVLVGALTGKDTDRLREEKRRGISIELGYARLSLPSGRAVSVVDVPGHERFVRTMVAGASGVDLFLLCVAADDGVMPQTLEHVAVLRALGVTRGVVALTKADRFDPTIAAEEVASLVPETEVVPVCAPRGEGLDDLLRAIDHAAAGLPSRSDDGPAVLHVDRSFTLKGIGTVVTGTLWSGAIGAGDVVTVLPREIEARVRSVQVHDRPLPRAGAGQRVALNLAGVRWRTLRRGDVVCSDPEALAATYLVDARIQLEDGVGLRRHQRVQVHHGTRETPARVVPLERYELEPGGSGLCQLRLEQPLVPAAGDRVVLRQIAPPDTLGGGEVVDPTPRKHGTLDERPERSQPDREPVAPAEPGSEQPALDPAALLIADVLRGDGERPRADAELAQAAGLNPAASLERLRALERDGRVVRLGGNLHFDATALSSLCERVIDICRRDGSTTIATVRDELGTNRRYAQALLEHLDSEKLTVRRGDAHFLRRRAVG